MNIVIRYTNFLYMTTTMYKESNILIMQKIKKIEQQQQDKKKIKAYKKQKNSKSIKTPKNVLQL